MKRPAVITDRDGTLGSVAYLAPAHRSNNPDCLLNSPDEYVRIEYAGELQESHRKCPCVDWDQYNSSIVFDAVIPGVAAILHTIRELDPEHDLTIIMTSGRDGAFRHEMATWIRKNELPIDVLLMRAPGDQRKDGLVKREIFERDIAPKYDVRFVLDDRPQVCDTWRDLGLPLIQVTDPGILPRIATQGGSVA